MRTLVLLIVGSLAFAQSPGGKPGVTDPIKDPSQIPGNPNPGPIPRATPQPAPTGKAEGSSGKQKKAKAKKKAASRSEQ
jgi:hypothetical protein